MTVLSNTGFDLIKCLIETQLNFKYAYAGVAYSAAYTGGNKQAGISTTAPATENIAPFCRFPTHPRFPLPSDMAVFFSLLHYTP